MKSHLHRCKFLLKYYQLFNKFNQLISDLSLIGRGGENRDHPKGQEEFLGADMWGGGSSTRACHGPAMGQSWDVPSAHSQAEEEVMDQLRHAGSSSSQD